MRNTPLCFPFLPFAFLGSSRRAGALLLVLGAVLGTALGAAGLGTVLRASGAAADSNLAAIDLLDPPVSYAAHRVVEIDGKAYSGRVFHMPGRTREDLRIDGKRHQLILNRSQGKAWLIREGMPFAIEIFAEQAEAMIATLPRSIEGMTVLGQETVAGVPTTKYRVQHPKVSGHVWINGAGVVMMAAGWTEDRKPFRMVLSEYQPGPQDPALFLLPAGQQRLIINARSMQGEDLRKILEGFAR